MTVSYSDGSSTESEPLAEQGADDMSPLPRPVLLTRRARSARQASSAPEGMYNVLDLLPLDTEGSSCPAQGQLQSETVTIAHTATVRASHSPLGVKSVVDTKGAAVIDANSPAVGSSCDKCRKLTLVEAARLVPQLRGVKTLCCHCCGLALPWFCFTSPQLQARRPECRGCRGAPSVIGMLTARVETMLREQQQHPVRASATIGTTPAAVPTTPSPPPTKLTTLTAPTLSIEPVWSARRTEALFTPQALSTVSNGPPRAPSPRKFESTLELPRTRRAPVVAPMERVRCVPLTNAPATLVPPAQPAPSVAATTMPYVSTAVLSQEVCSRCSWPLEQLNAGHLEMKKKPKCSCCERALPPAFYGVMQLKTKGGARRCKGCTGKVGSPTAAQVKDGMQKWGAQPIHKQRSARKRLIKLKASLAKQRTIGGEVDASDIMNKEKMLAKLEHRVAKKKLLSDEVLEAIDDIVANRVDEFVQRTQKTSKFHRRVAKHRFAVLALARKRAENDLRGATRVEYMKELAKEEAFLEHQAGELKRQNKRVFDEVMGLPVERPSEANGEKTKKRSRASREVVSDDDDLLDGFEVGVDIDEPDIGHASPERKRPRVSGGTVTTSVAS